MNAYASRGTECGTRSMFRGVLIAALLFMAVATDAHAEKHGGEPGFNMATYLLPDQGTGAWVIDPETTWRHDDAPPEIPSALGMRRFPDDGSVVPLPVQATESPTSTKFTSPSSIRFDADGERLIYSRPPGNPSPGPSIVLSIQTVQNAVDEFEELQSLGPQAVTHRVPVASRVPAPLRVIASQVIEAWIIDTMMQGRRGPSGSLVAINPPEPEENALYYDFALVKGGGCVFTMVWRNTLSVWYHPLGSGMPPKGPVYAHAYRPQEPVWSRWAVFDWPWDVTPHQILSLSKPELRLLRGNDQVLTFSLPDVVDESRFVPLIDIRDPALGLREPPNEMSARGTFSNAIMRGGPEALLGTERQKGPEREEVLPAPVERILKIVGEGKTLLYLADGTTLAIERDATEPRTARSEEISLWESIAAKNKSE